MESSPDDRQVRELVQRLKSGDRARTPSFNAVLARPRGHRASRGPFVMAAACGVAVAALLAIVIAWAPWKPAPRDGGTGAKDGVVVGVPIDEQLFANLHALVDEELAAVEAPDWPSVTDSLLSLNTPSGQE